MIRTLVADDQEAARWAVRLILDAEPDIEVIDEAGDGAEAVEKARWRGVDVVVLDLRMPRLDGVAAIRRIAESINPAPAVVALTTFDVDEYCSARSRRARRASCSRTANRRCWSTRSARRRRGRG